MNQMWCSVLISLGAGVVSSALYASILCFVKPKIVVSEEIALEKDSLGFHYRIKVVNRTRRSLVNLHYSLNYVEYSGRSIIKLKPVKQSENKYIFYTIDRHRKKVKDECEQYAIWLCYDTKEEIKIGNNNFLEFEFTATHPWSNVTKCFEMKYKTQDKIVEGKFETGDSCRISPR